MIAGALRNPSTLNLAGCRVFQSPQPWTFKIHSDSKPETRALHPKPRNATPTTTRNQPKSTNTGGTGWQGARVTSCKSLNTSHPKPTPQTVLPTPQIPLQTLHPNPRPQNSNHPKTERHERAGGRHSIAHQAGSASNLADAPRRSEDAAAGIPSPSMCVYI